MKRRLTDKPEPPVLPAITLSEIAGCIIDLDCPLCGHHSERTATELMKTSGGAATLKSVLDRMRCARCKRNRAPEVGLRSGPTAAPYGPGVIDRPR